MARALRAAQAAIDAEDYGSAIALLQPLQARHPRSTHVLIHLARALAGAGQMEQAAACFQQARELTSRPPVIDLLWGEALLRREQLPEAEDALRQALAADRKNSIAANWLALCLFRQGRHGEALALWRQHGWSHNQSYLVEITIAFEQFLLQAPAAPPVLDESIDPNEMVLRGQANRPLSALGRRLRLKPLLDKAERLLTNQKTLEAYRLTAKALELAPENQDALLLRAVALYEMERYEEAGRILLDLSAEESSPLPRYFLAYSLLRLGEIEVAEAMMARMTPQGPFDYYLHYHLGLARLLRGDLKAARESYGIAYREYFIDSREYCFEHLVNKVQAAVERLDPAPRKAMQ